MSNYKENKGSIFSFLHNDSYYSNYDIPRYEKASQAYKSTIKIVVKIYEKSRRYLHFIVR